jgi:hypothetical protein
MSSASHVRVYTAKSSTIMTLGCQSFMRANDLSTTRRLASGRPLNNNVE